MRLLVVEDHPSLAAGLVQGLKEAGYAVDLAKDGEEALHCARGAKYDAVLLDLMLPKLDGFGVLKQLRAQTAEYQKILTDTQVIPAFHMVVAVADKYPGDDQDYNHRVDTAVIQKWVEWAKQENVWVILDIQAGRGDVLTEINQIEPFLYQPHVQLAIDPEFIVGSKEFPGDNLGTIDGETINQIQERLDQIAVAIGQTKVLIIHQFDDRMLKNKDQILNYENVEMVWDADGFGGPGAKIQDYTQYRHEPGFDRGGIKLFYIEDTPLMTPAQVMELLPMPSIVIYQ